jgi:pantetheine-phosphate adenylyltransferase
MTVTGFYSGSFDPISLGHVDLIERAARIVSRLVIGVGVHHGKAPMFTWQERVEMIEHAIGSVAQHTGTPISVVTFNDLAVDAARAHGARVIVRGLRDATDFDYEMQMAGTNAVLASDIETIFLGASPGRRHIASKFIRQIAAMGGDVEAFVPPLAAQRLRAKFAGHTD